MHRPLMISILILLIGPIAVGQDDLWTEYRDMMKGGWVTEGEIDEGIQGAVAKGGDKYRMQSTFWSALDGKALIGRQTFRIVEKSDYTAQSHYVAGWNPSKKVIDIRVYWTDGDIDEATIAGKEGNAYLVDYTFTGGTGNAASQEARFTVVDDNTITWGQPGKKTSTWKRVTRATATDPAVDMVEYYSYFVGEWDVTAEVDGQRVEGTFVVKLGPSGKSHVTRLEFGERCGEGIYGPDPITGRWTGTGFENDGTFWQEVFSPPKRKLRSGVSFTSRGTRKTSEGSKTTEAGKLTIVDEKTFTAESPEATYRLTRKKGEVALHSDFDGSAEKPQSPYYEKYEILDTWVGDWTTSTKVEGVEFKGDFACRWVPGRSCVAWTWQAPGAKTTLISTSGYGILGWDPARNQIVESGFGSNGLAYTTYFDVKGNSLHGTRHTVMPTGDKFTEKMIFTSHKDRIAIKNIERRDVEGNLVPMVFPEEGAFVRKK